MTILDRIRELQKNLIQEEKDLEDLESSMHKLKREFESCHRVHYCGEECFHKIDMKALEDDSDCISHQDLKGS